MKKYIFLVIFFFGLLSVSAQNPRKIIDSIQGLDLQSLPLEQRYKAYSDLTWYYKFVDIDSAIIAGKTAIQLAEESKNPKFISQSLSDYGAVFLAKGNFPEALSQYRKALKIRKQNNDSLGMASIHSNMGAVFERMTAYDSSMVYYLKALPYFEKTKNDRYVDYVKNNMGVVYELMRNFPEALKIYKEVAAYREKEGDLRSIGMVYSNLGNIYQKTKDFSRAERYLIDASKLLEEAGDNTAAALAYHNLGTLYNEMAQPQKALAANKKAVLLGNDSNSEYDLAMMDLALARTYKLTHDYQNSKNLYLRAIKKLNSLESPDNLRHAYLNIIPVYGNLRMPDSAEFYLQKYIEVANTAVEDRIANETLELATRYETEKKENEILQQRAQLAEKDLEVRQKNTLIFGSLGLALVLGLIGYLLYNQQKLKNRQLQKEGELKTALVKIETQNKLQEQRLRISRDLHDNIGAQLTFIISSIDNLKYSFSDIGEKLGNKLTSISNFTAQTIYELRDTIWAMNKENITFEDLQARIANFIEQAQSASEKTDFSFNIDENVDASHVFTSVEGMNVYRIIQESVNNSLKYSAADEIEVNISKANNNYKIEVTDNGVGFDLSSIEMGNGLNNMKKRAQEIGAKLQVKSSKKGTAIILEIA